MMNVKKEYNSCNEVKNYFSYYTIPQAALLWCGVSPDEVHDELQKANPIAESPSLLKNVFKHPYISCMEPRCRALQMAIDDNKLQVGRDGGRTSFMSEAGGHVAYNRRTINREDLKAWIARTFPNDKPAFLFDDIERATHSAINADSFRALQADRDSLKVRLEKAEMGAKEIKEKYNDLQGERDSLKAIVEKSYQPNERSETTYLNIIGGLLDLMLGKSPGGVKHSIYDNQSAIISALLAYHGDKEGISSRTLEGKFAAANRSLKSS